MGFDPFGDCNDLGGSSEEAESFDFNQQILMTGGDNDILALPDDGKAEVYIAPQPRSSA